MQKELTINVDEEVYNELQRIGGPDDISQFIERAIQAYVAQHTQHRSDARELEVINEFADILNQEASDVLEYQVAL